MPDPLTPGDLIHGYAYGAFGRDSYDCRRIEAVGPDWIVTRDDTGATEFVSNRRSLELCQQARDEPCKAVNYGDSPCPFTTTPSQGAPR